MLPEIFVRSVEIKMRIVDQTFRITFSVYMYSDRFCRYFLLRARMRINKFNASVEIYKFEGKKKKETRDRKFLTSRFEGNFAVIIVRSRTTRCR